MTGKECFRGIRRCNFGCVFWSALFGGVVSFIPQTGGGLAPLAFASLLMAVACTGRHDYLLRQAENRFDAMRDSCNKMGFPEEE